MATRTEPATIPAVFGLIEDLGKKLDNLERQTMQGTGLTPPQYAALNQLWDEDGLQLKDLASGNRCTPATMTAIVDTLERKGLVERTPHPSDRRSLRIMLTTEGRNLQGSTPTLQDMFRGCCSGLSPDETAELAQLLTKLDSALTAWEPSIQP